MVGYKRGLKRKADQAFIYNNKTYGYGNGLIGPANQRKYMTSKKVKVANAVTKYSSSSFRRGEEIKTMDVLFIGNYAQAYTPDTVPLQQLNMNTGTASVQALNLIQQGAGISQRIGNKISLKSLRLRLSISTTTNNNDSITNGRVLLLYDRQPNTAYTASNSMLSSSRQDNTIVAGIWSDNINPNFFDRFVVLMDKKIVLPPDNTGSLTTNSTAGPTCISSFEIDEYINLKNLESQFNGTASPLTIAYINIGALLLVGYGDQAGGLDPWCLKGSARLRFRDN